MKHNVTKGKTYLVTAKDETTVTDVESGYILKVVPANSQDLVVAISDAIETSGECHISPFVEATRTHLELNPSSAGGSASGEPEGDYVTMDANGVITGGRLDNLVDGYYLQYYKTTLTSWDIELPALVSGTSMFSTSGLTSWNVDLPSLTETQMMFYKCWSLVTFKGDMPALVTASNNMFSYDSSLISFESNMPALVTASSMFGGCTALISFKGDVSALAEASAMFRGLASFTSFESDLPALKTGYLMFSDCLLNKESAMRVLLSIPEWTDGANHFLHLGIHIDHQADEEVLAAIDAANAKGWAVAAQWNGTATAAAVALGMDEIYAKCEQDENGNYVDANNTRYIVDWGHMVTSPDATPAELGYELFYSLDEALTKWGLTELMEIPE